MRNKLEFYNPKDTTKAYRWEKYNTKEITHHVWDKYHTTQTPTWVWNEYNADSEQRYFWDQREIQHDNQYLWKKYDVISHLISTNYYWDRYTVHEENQYPTWQKEQIDSDTVYRWKARPAVIDTEKSTPRYSWWKWPASTISPSSQDDYPYVNRAFSAEAGDCAFNWLRGKRADVGTVGEWTATMADADNTYGMKVCSEYYPTIDSDGCILMPDGVTRSSGQGNAPREQVVIGTINTHSWTQYDWPDTHPIQSIETWKAEIYKQLKEYNNLFLVCVDTVYDNYHPERKPIAIFCIHYDDYLVFGDDYIKITRPDKKHFTVTVKNTAESIWVRTTDDWAYGGYWHINDTYDRFNPNVCYGLWPGLGSGGHFSYNPVGSISTTAPYIDGTGKIIPLSGVMIGSGYSMRWRKERWGGIPRLIVSYTNDYPLDFDKTITQAAPGVGSRIHYDSSENCYYSYAGMVYSPVYKPNPDDTTEYTVKSKDRQEHPEGLDTNSLIYYTYDGWEWGQNYFIQAVYIQGFDPTTHGYPQCQYRPRLDHDTGEIFYADEGQGNYFVNLENNGYYELLENSDVIFWYLLANEGASDIYEYGDYLGQFITNSAYLQQMDIVLSVIYSAGQYVEQVMAIDDPLAYPSDGKQGDYWYIYQQEVPEYFYEKGDYIEDVTVLNQMRYPIDGRATDNYWYVFVDATEVLSAGSLMGQVNNVDRNAYPYNGIANGYWYIYDKFSTLYVRGRLRGQVSSTNDSAYPADGKQGDYWYVFDRHFIDTTKTEYIERIDRTDPDEFPQDGALGRYWYVHVEEYNQFDPTTYLTEVWSNNQDEYPESGKQDNYYYIYLGYMPRPLYIIAEDILKSFEWQQEVNPDEDMTPGTVASAQITFSIFDNLRDSQKYLNLECDYYNRMGDEDTWVKKGHYTITDAKAQTNVTTTLIGFDNVIKLDKIADSLIFNTIEYPISLTSLYNTIVEWCDCTPIINFTLPSYQVNDNFRSTNMTARQVLAFLAQACGGFVKADDEGHIVLRRYEQKNEWVVGVGNTIIDLEDDRYTKISQAIYETQKVNKVNVAMATDDIGVSYGSGEVVFRIIDNPLLYIQAESELTPILEPLYNYMSSVAYTPVKISLLQDFGIETGDIIKVDGQTAYIMSKRVTDSGVELECKGNKERVVESNGVNGSIDKLRGKSNELTRTIDETNSRITDVEAGLKSEISQTASQLRSTITSTKLDIESEITQTASDINTRITDTQNGLESKISQTAGEINTSVDDKIAQTKTEIKQTTDSISSTVSSQGQTISSIQQGLDGIQLTYNSSNGTASLKIGDITVSQLTDAGYVQRQVAGIDLTGYVRFNDLSHSGSTVINGDNITTGTISANRINLTGAISWGDLSDNVQDRINDAGGGGGQSGDIPSYIHSTYIDATRIISPTIQGGTLSAGTSADGYMSLSSTGMNFHSSSKTICGIGYYSGYYEYPFIVLGSGVDASATDQGLIKKYSDGIWIGDSDAKNSSTLAGSSSTGIFISFQNNRIYKYINGTPTQL